ncbi:MAG: hemolysin family protein [Anaerolineae bacterium]
MFEQGLRLVVLKISAVAALIFLNGFFVAVEFGLVSVRRTRIEQMVEQGNRLARLVQEMLEHTDRILAACQLGITMASLALGWIGEATVAALVEPPLAALARSLPGIITTGVAHAIGIVVSFSFITALHIVIGEQAPKTFAIRYPETVTMWSARPTLWFDRIFRPFIWFLDRAASTTLRMVGVQPVAVHGTVYSIEELKRVVSESQESGVLDEQQEVMVRRVFEFGDRLAREVMVPRPDVIAIQVDAALDDLLALFAQHTHARFPVYEHDLDHILGFISIKQVLKALATGAKRTDGIAPLIRPAVLVPETRRVDSLFVEMRDKDVQMAVVIDEYGGTAGIVTLEELVEEVVGRVGDELMPGLPPYRRVDEKTVEIDAGMRIDELNDELGIELPDHPDYETVAGFVLFQLHRIPEPGDHLRYDNLRITVTEMRGPKIEKLVLMRLG